MKKIERTIGEQDVRWTIPSECGERTEIYWAFGCPNVTILNYGPRPPVSDHDCAVVPIAVLDELITLSRDRPEQQIEDQEPWKDTHDGRRE